LINKHLFFDCKKRIFFMPRCGIIGRNWVALHGQQGVFCDSEKFGQDAKRNGPAFGCFSQGRTEFWAGMEEYPRSCRTTGSLSFGQETVSAQKEHALLGDTEMSSGDQTILSSMGISSWRTLLVY
jgi:hypothetical protein